MAIRQILSYIVNERGTGWQIIADPFYEVSSHTARNIDMRDESIDLEGFIQRVYPRNTHITFTVEGEYNL